MKAFLFLATLVIFSSFSSAPKDVVSLSDSTYTIIAKFVDKETEIPVEVLCTLCHQIGDEPIELREETFSEKGEIRLDLPKKSSEHPIAILPCPVKIEIDNNGDTIRHFTTGYYSRYVPVALPDSGNVCILPIIKLEPCNDPKEYYWECIRTPWPYPLPQKLIDLEREQNTPEYIKQTKEDLKKFGEFMKKKKEQESKADSK